MFSTHKHGGQLGAASRRYGIPLAEWLDLSTGISPFVYPVPAVPAQYWQRLPETADGLEQAAAAYYGSDYLLPVAGSQQAINLLPHLQPARQQVAILSPAYHSHQQAWQQAGHQLHYITAKQLEQQLADFDAVVVVNPRNPNADYVSSQQLQAWRAQLHARGGCLIVDEAFIDCSPKQSLITAEPQAGLVVLRSIGKFFGLAGIRLGFVWAKQATLQALAARQDDWSVSNLARWAGRHALADTAWQQQQRQRLQAAGERLQQLLQQHYQVTVSHTPLFAYLPLQQAQAEQQRLAQQGILVRAFTHPAALRFGLPATEAQWQRLQQALSASS